MAERKGGSPAPLRLAFMGTPEFALPTLRALIESGHRIAAVYTQPPRPDGCGHKEQASTVPRLAEAGGIPVRTPASLKDGDVQAAFADLGLDAAVVVAYGLILPAGILSAPRLGCLNLHASLLPRWRGAAPIQRAIMAGDRETGATVMLMDEGLDTGPILLQEPVPIGPRTTAGELHDLLAARGAPLVLEALAGLAAGTLRPRPQPEEGATYAPKLERRETRLDWSRPAGELERLVRACAPAPGAWFLLDGERIRVLAAEVVRDGGVAPPGTVVDEALAVACREGLLRLLRVQRAGRRPLDAAAFLRGRPVPAGTVLPLPEEPPERGA